MDEHTSIGPLEDLLKRYHRLLAETLQPRREQYMTGSGWRKACDSRERAIWRLCIKEVVDLAVAAERGR